jgi:hypothetical protein
VGVVCDRSGISFLRSGRSICCSQDNVTSELIACCFACAGDVRAKCRGSVLCCCTGHDAGDVWKESEEWQAAWRRKLEAAEQRQQERQQKQAAKQQQQEQQKRQQQQQPGGGSVSHAAAPSKGQKTDQKPKSKQQAPRKPAQQPGSKP